VTNTNNTEINDTDLILDDDDLDSAQENNADTTTTLVGTVDTGIRTNRSGNPWVRPFALSDLENRSSEDWAYEKLDIVFKHVLNANNGDSKIIQQFATDYCKKWRPLAQKREQDAIEREKKQKAKQILEGLKNSGMTLEELAKFAS
jgi:hypothetical protein